MPGTLSVLWTIRLSTSTPKPILRCSRCDRPKPFEPSGKFRLNANGKRLDAWLIYRCEQCGDAWNRAIFERRRRSEIDDAVLEALQCNDPAFADEVARDMAGLARWTTRFDDGGDAAIVIDKALLDGTPTEADRMAIRLSLPAGASMRCDRLLAAGLGVSRSRVAVMATDGRVAVHGASGKPLARSLQQGSLVTLALHRHADAPTLLARGAGLDVADLSPTGRPAD